MGNVTSSEYFFGNQDFLSNEVISDRSLEKASTQPASSKLFVFLGRTKTLREQAYDDELARITAELQAEREARPSLLADVKHLSKGAYHHYPAPTRASLTLFCPEGEEDDLVEVSIEFEGSDDLYVKVRRDTDGINLKRVALEALKRDWERQGRNADDVPFEWDSTLFFAGEPFEEEGCLEDFGIEDGARLFLGIDLSNDASNVEKRALMELYRLTGGDGWVNRCSWGIGEGAPESWQHQKKGVRETTKEGHVKWLFLNTNGLASNGSKEWQEILVDWPQRLCKLRRLDILGNDGLGGYDEFVRRMENSGEGTRYTVNNLGGSFVWEANDQ